MFLKRLNKVIKNERNKVRKKERKKETKLESKKERKKERTKASGGSFVLRVYSEGDKWALDE
jgi:hypothetical protein